jgi:MFS family permease
MSDRQPSAPDTAPTAVTPETTTFLLATFAEFYRQELGAEEDVHRSLPFFGTALGLVIGALAYAAGRLPKWGELAGWRSATAFLISAVFLILAVAEACFVLFWLFRAITQHRYRRVGPENALMLRLDDLRGYYTRQSLEIDHQDGALATDMRQALLDSYLTVTPQNRDLNQRRYRLRALAASHLVRSLIWALCATTIILVADKVGYLPKVIQ